MKQLVKEKSLVVIQKDDVFTNSKIISEHAGVQHVAVQKITEKYKNDFEEFGKLKYKNFKFENSGRGRPKKIYLYNEQQATLLLTYLKNTKPVREFKKALVKQFYEAKKRLKEIKTPEYQQLRLTAKSSTKTLHDTIKEKYIPYAIESGSKTYKENPGLAYNNFEKVVNKSLQIVVKGREYLNKREQTRLDMVNNIIKCLIEDCIGKQVEYHKIVELAKTKVKQIAGLFDFEDISTQV